jgi:DNA-binding MarR family transcriptional regulator
MTNILQLMTGAERDALKTLARALEPFRNVHNSLPLQYCQTLLAIAIEPDMTTNEIAEATGIPAHTVSRQLADCGKTNRYHRPGYGLVETREDVMDRRFHRTNLTPLGRALAGQVVKAMGKAA